MGFLIPDAPMIGHTRRFSLSMRRKGGQEASVGVTEGVNRQNDLLTAVSLSYWIWRLSHRLAVTPLFQEIEKDVGWSVDRFFLFEGIDRQPHPLQSFLKEEEASCPTELCHRTLLPGLMDRVAR